MGLGREGEIGGSLIRLTKLRNAGDERKPKIREQTRGPCPRCQKWGIVITATCDQQNYWILKRK